MNLPLPGKIFSYSKCWACGLLLPVFLLFSFSARGHVAPDTPPVAAINVSGKVTDEKGVGIPGVNVLVKGTTTGTVTNTEGVYQVQVENENAVLVFSSIGYVAQEITVGNRQTIDVSLQPDITELSEIVVVGYGTQKREDLTGAIASVSGEDLKKVFITTPDQAMQGRVAGVQVRTTSHEPGGGISVQIRGTSSLSASSQPLYVIDGFPISNDYESVAAEKGHRRRTSSTRSIRQTSNPSRS